MSPENQSSTIRSFPFNVFARKKKTHVNLHGHEIAARRQRSSRHANEEMECQDDVKNHLVSESRARPQRPSLTNKHLNTDEELPDWKTKPNDRYMH